MVTAGKGTDAASAPTTGHHGSGMVGGCPLEAPATETGAVGLLAPEGLEPITIMDAPLQKLRSSAGGACS